jgi:hypothetical protein
MVPPDATTAKTPPAKKAKVVPPKLPKSTKSPEPPPEPVRVLNLLYVGHRPKRGDYSPDEGTRLAHLALLRISELPEWMREIIEREYEAVVHDEELPSDDEGTGRSFGFHFNDAGGLDIEWMDPNDAASWFHTYMPCRDREGMLKIVTSSDIEMGWHAVNALVKIKEEGDETSELQTKRWCELEEVALKKAMRTAAYHMFDPDVVDQVDDYLNGHELHYLGKKKRGVHAIATITIHLDKWVL